MLEYLIKSTTCMLLFLGFYKLLLEKESLHLLKRYYLLGALVLSLVIPKIIFATYVIPEDPIAVSDNIDYLISFPTIDAKIPSSKINIVLLLWNLYGLGVAVFGIRFFIHLFQLVGRIRSNPKTRKNGIVTVLLDEDLPPHTFFNYVFLNRAQFTANTIPQEVLTHEETHARQYHSLDVLFIELLRVLLWFNPLLIWFKKSILLNHEFLADRAVLQSVSTVGHYQKILFAFLVSEREHVTVEMANAITYSSIKKRLLVMRRKTSKKAMLLRTVILVLFVALLTYGFGEKQILALTQQEQTISPDLRQTQEGASRTQMKEYNTLAKKYNAMTRDAFHIKRKEVDRMEYIYDLMSARQREDAEPFPEILEPPMPAEPPTPGTLNAASPEPPAFPAPITAENQIGHIKEMAQKGAVFYLEGKKTSASKIIALLENQGTMNIMTRRTGDANYVVQVSADPSVPKE